MHGTIVMPNFAYDEILLKQKLIAMKKTDNNSFDPIRNSGVNAFTEQDYKRMISASYLCCKRIR